MTRTSQIRLVLASKHKPLADKILEETGIDTYTQLFSIFLVNYGDPLVQALKGCQQNRSAVMAKTGSLQTSHPPQTSPKSSSFTPLTDF